MNQQSQQFGDSQSAVESELVNLEQPTSTYESESANLQRLIDVYESEPIDLHQPIDIYEPKSNDESVDTYKPESTMGGGRYPL